MHVARVALRKSIALAGLSLVPLISLAVPTLAATWAPALPLADTIQPVSQPVVARGVGGREAASWVEGDHLAVSVRDGAANWPAATHFPARQAGALLTPVEVLVDGHGDVTVGWLEGPANDRRLLTRALRAGIWQDVRTLSSAATAAAALAMDGAGNVTAAWLQAGTAAGSCDIRAADAPAGQAFAGATVLSHDCRNEIDLAVNARGDALVAWSNRLVIRGGSPVIAAQRAAGGSWSLPVIVAAPTYRSHSARVALADNGKAVAVWADAYGPQFARRNAAGRWTAAAPVDPAGRWPYTGQNDVVIDAQGNATAILGAWDASYVAQGLVASRLGAAATQWSAMQRITAAGATIEAFSVQATPAGNLVVGWMDSTLNANGMARGVGVSVREAGTWSRKLLARGQRDIAVTAGGGEAVAIWNGGVAAGVRVSRAALP